MKKNYSETIKDKQKRTLTAKAYKFVHNCIEISANQEGLTRYHAQMKPLKEKIYSLMNYLILDKELSIQEIKELIKNRKLLIHK